MCFAVSPHFSGHWLFCERPQLGSTYLLCLKPTLLCPPHVHAVPLSFDVVHYCFFLSSQHHLFCTLCRRLVWFLCSVPPSLSPFPFFHFAMHSSACSARLFLAPTLVSLASLLEISRCQIYIQDLARIKTSLPAFPPKQTVSGQHYTHLCT